MDSHPKEKKKDRTGMIISIVVHVAIAGALLYIISRTEFGQKIWERTIGATRDRRKTDDKPKPPPATTQKARPKPSDAPPPPSGGRRATDAPAAVGEGLLVDRTKGKGGEIAGSGVSTSAPPPKLVAPPPPRATFQAAPASTIKAAMQERAKATAAIESFSSEQISRSGAGDVGEVVGKVAGATVVEGKFAIIRGLPDRYASATLNGGEIPSADPYRKSVQLDVFPSGMIDKVVIAKTFTPDKPGGFSGGAIDIVSKSFPERFQFSISGGLGYNTSATFNDQFLTYPGSGTDWLGMDDGKRAEPAQVAKIENIGALPSSMIVAAPTDNPANQQAALKPIQDYVALQRSFTDRNFGPLQDAPGMNRSFSMSVGDSTYFLGRRLGFFGALTYDRKFSFYEDGQQSRFVWPAQQGAEKPSPDPASPRANLNDTRGIDEISWGGTATMAYEIFPDHQLGFTFLNAQNAEDLARRRIGPASQDNVEKGDISFLNELHWTERNLNTFQFNGKHFFEEVGGTQLDWLYSLANATQEEPDYRLFNFAVTPEGTINISGSSGAPEPSGGPSRLFRDLEEDTSTVKMDLTIPFRQWNELQGEIKGGGYMTTSERDYRERAYTFKPGETPPGGFTGNPLTFPNEFLDDDQLSIKTNRTNPRSPFPTSYAALTSFTDELGNSFMEGRQEIQAVYAMGTLPVSERLRLIGGVRYETTDLQTESFSRILGFGKGSIQENDLLPAAGFIYAPRKDMNIRFNFAQTVARPTYREFSNLRSYDVTGDEIFVGNTNLAMSHIDNFDLRWEWFPRPGELLSMSVFYKNIQEPIERIAIDARKGDEIQYRNFPEAKVYGVEFEIRKSLDFLDHLLSNFSLGINLSLIESESENVPEILSTKKEAGFHDETRPLFDQSPYIASADLTYDNRHLGTTITVAYSEFGERLYLVNNAGADVYEQPAPSLDIILSQRLGRHWKIKLSAKNLLDPAFERKYGQSGELDREYIYSSYKKGRTFSLSLGFDF